MRKSKALWISYSAIIAALYVLLTFISRIIGLDSGIIQVRISEMLCILPLFTGAAIPGLTVGCFLANLLSGAQIFDLVFGTLATLIGAVGTYLLRKYKWLAPLPPIVSNAVIIPLVLAWGYKMEQAIPLMILTVLVGEIISVYVLGMLLYFALKKREREIFNNLR